MTSRRRTSSYALVALVALTALVLAGCGAAADRLTEEAVEKGAEKLAEQGGAGDVDVELDDEGVSVEGEDGSFTGGTTLPDDWPEDLPLPEQDHEITSAISQSDGEHAFHQVALELDADPHELQDFYESALTDAGLEVGTRETTSGDRVSLGVSGGTADESRDVQVVIIAQGDGPVTLRITSQTDPS